MCQNDEIISHALTRRPEKMQNSLVVQFGFELCLLAFLLAKAVDEQGHLSVASHCISFFIK